MPLLVIFWALSVAHVVTNWSSPIGR